MDIKNKIEKIGGLEEMVSKTEQPVIPEKKVETERPPMPEGEKTALVREETGKKPMIAAVVHPITEKPVKSETLVKIEKILEEDLEGFYFSMPTEQRKLFKEKGEETASRILKMIETGKTVGRKILKLIRDWLKLIPGVNKFFLEQEAKIKTDRVVTLVEKKKIE